MSGQRGNRAQEELAVVREALETFLRDTHRPLPGRGIEAETVVFGTGGVLDSLGLVGFIGDLETRVAERFGVDIVLADERAMSRSRSPFRTVQSLADLVAERIAEAKKA